MIEFLKYSSFYSVLAISILINGLLYFLSIAGYTIVSRVSSEKTIQKEKQPLLRKDILLSLRIVFVNAIVFIWGVFLWKNDYIILNENQQRYVVILETILLLMSMDFLMYCFHRMVHFARIFPLIHKRHHLHVSTNAISLFVLHPLEALGFGLLFMMVIFLHSFSVISISVYLILNVLWGTMGHLNVEIFPKRFSKIMILNQLGTTEFHNLHHQFPNYNLGFYTIFWDQLFGTLAPFSNEEIKENNGFYLPSSLKVFIKELKENSEKFDASEFEYYNDTWIWDLDGEVKVTFKGQKAEFSNLDFNNDTFLTLVRIGILECTKEFTFEDKTSKYRLVKQGKESSI